MALKLHIICKKLPSHACSARLLGTKSPEASEEHRLYGRVGQSQGLVM